MRRAALLAAILLLLFALAILIGITLLHRDRRLPPQAQVRLDQYLAYAFPGDQTGIAVVDRAAHPSRLTGETAGVTFADSVHFQTDLGASDIDSESRPPLPFPPTDVWCVLLEGEGPPAGQVVLIAMHVDLHSADWIVHQGPADASSVEAQHLLSILGCTLTPEPGDFNALDRARQNGHRWHALQILVTSD